MCGMSINVQLVKPQDNPLVKMNTASHETRTPDQQL